MKNPHSKAGSPARPGSAWIVELQPQVRMWLAPWTGDPGRTCVEASAKPFGTLAAAKAALTRARRYSPFKSARSYLSPNAPASATCGGGVEWEECNACGGEGGTDGYEEDPLWYRPGEIAPCPCCNGRGGEYWCANSDCSTTVIMEIVRSPNAPRSATPEDKQ